MTSALQVKEKLPDAMISIRPTPGWADPYGNIDMAAFKAALDKWGKVQAEHESRINIDLADLDG